MTTPPRIVVGVDGSDGSQLAFAHALRQARLTGSTLEVVHAFHVPIPWGAAGFVGPAGVPDPAELEAAGHRVIDQVIGHPVPTDVTIERIVSMGGSAQVLLDVARGADLLVVGARGLGGFRGLLLGSTSLHVVTHAPCPVVVVPATLADHVARSA